MQSGSSSRQTVASPSLAKTSVVSILAQLMLQLQLYYSLDLLSSLVCARLCGFHTYIGHDTVGRQVRRGTAKGWARFRVVGSSSRARTSSTSSSVSTSRQGTVWASLLYDEMDSHR